MYAWRLNDYGEFDFTAIRCACVKLPFGTYKENEKYKILVSEPQQKTTLATQELLIGY
jgi:hypothetical protein